MCFERLHLPALIISERPLLALFGIGSLTGLVIDIGRHSTEVDVGFDSVLVPHGNARALVGREDLDNYLCHLLLKAQPNLPDQLSPSSPLSPTDLHAALLAIVGILRDGGYLYFASAALSLNVAADGSRMEVEEEVDTDDALDDVAKALVSGKAAAILGKSGVSAAQAAKLANVTVSGEHVTMPNPLNSATTITVGPERHRFAEPLFDPSFLREVTGFGVAYSTEDLARRAASVPEAIAAAVKSVWDLRERVAIWEHVIVGGKGTAKGVAPAIIQSLAGYVGAYASRPKLAKIPDYFPEYKDRLDLAAFLGASIVAKVPPRVFPGARLRY
jgi:actin-related protein 9